MVMFILSALVLSLVSVVVSQPTEHVKRDSTPLATVYSHCIQPNTVALTFDDGPYTWSKTISDMLTNAGAKGTFFYNGNNYDCIYNDNEVANVLYAYNGGHQIASHTWSHPDLTTLSQDQINNEMWLIEQAILRITGAYPAFLRPPYGSYNDLVLQVVSARNQSVVMWDFDSGDSTGSIPDQQKQSYDDVIAKKPNTILTHNHEVYETTVTETIPYAIQKLQAAGYRLVTVAECLGMPAYQYVQAPGVRDSTWHC